MRILWVAALLIVWTTGATARAAEGPATLPATGVALAGPNEVLPIAVWLQAPHNAAKYKALGINLYVGLWQGPTAEQLSALEKAGMPVACAQNAEGLKPQWSKEIVAWLQDDEPDNAQGRGEGKGYGPPVAPAAVVARYRTMKAADARPVILNLGQGVAWDGWHGRGVRTNKPEDYPEYVKGGDIVSFDIYPVVHDRPAVAGKLWYVGRGTERLVSWTQGKKPVWACIECTHIGNSAKKATPEQVRAEVWMALIHGARGIVYFVHQFAPKFVEAGLLEDPAMMAAIKQLNAEIQELAPVLLADAGGAAAKVESSSGANAGIATATRRHGGATYVFTVGMSDATTQGTFRLAGAEGSVEVLHENRTVPVHGAAWSDTFHGYEVHLYRLASPSATTRP